MGIGSKGKRFGREWLYLEGVTLAVWWVSYIPLGFILQFNLLQWEVWFTAGAVYDVVAAYPVSKAVLLLYNLGLRRKWFA